MQGPHSEITQSELRQLALKSLRDPGDPDGIVVFEALLKIEPSNPNHWYNLAYLQRHAGRYRDAIQSYSEALARGIARPEEVYVNRAAILYEHSHAIDAAKADLTAALEIHPNYVPALSNLSLIAEDSGNRDEASSLHERVLAADPANATSQAKLALLDQSAPRAIDRLNRWLSSTTAGSPARAELLFALGTVLDREQAFDKAFAAILEANAIRKSMLPEHARYNPQTIESLVGAVRVHPFGDWPTGPSTAQIVSVCGLFRSGSTLIEHVLSAHSQIEGLGEVDSFSRSVDRHLPHFPHCKVSTSDVAKLSGEYLARLPKFVSKWAVDKRPDNIMLLGGFLVTFPQSKAIITRRHTLDNLLSILFLDFADTVNYALDIDDAAHWASQVRKLRDCWQTLFPQRVLDVSYDDFVQSPQTKTKVMLDFLGLDYDVACDNAHLQSRIVRTPSAWQVRKETFTASSGRWRNYEKFLTKQIDLMQC